MTQPFLLWKGLIDGSTGAYYYWNPETNVSQYERPPDAPHPFSRTPLPVNAAPSLTPTTVAHTSQPNVLMVQQRQQQSGCPQLIQPALQTHHYPALQTPQQQGTQPLEPQSHMVQMQQMPYQQNLAAKRQPIPYQQGQMPVQQVPLGTFPLMEDLVYQHGKPGSHSASQMENSGTHPSHVPLFNRQPRAAKEVPGYSINAPEDHFSVRVQHGQNDGSQKQQFTPPPHRAPKHTGHSMLQHPQGGSLGSIVGYDMMSSTIAVVLGRKDKQLTHSCHSQLLFQCCTINRAHFPLPRPMLIMYQDGMLLKLLASQISSISQLLMPVVNNMK